MSNRVKMQSTLQLEIDTDYEWDKLLEKKELIVVDVYSGWWGPCASMVPTLQKVKEQVGKDIIFATANSDKITFLEKFRDKSEPTWLLLIGGKIINVVYGTNYLKLLSTISKELKKELQIQKGRTIRTELEIDDIPKEEPPLVRPPPPLAPEEPPPAPPPKPTSTKNDEFLYQPFRVTYYK